MRHWQPRQHCWHLRNGWQAPQALHRRGRCGERAQQQHDTAAHAPTGAPAGARPCSGPHGPQHAMHASACGATGQPPPSSWRACRALAHTRLATTAWQPYSATVATILHSRSDGLAAARARQMTPGREACACRPQPQRWLC